MRRILAAGLLALIGCEPLPSDPDPAKPAAVVPAKVPAKVQPEPPRGDAGLAAPEDLLRWLAAAYRPVHDARIAGHRRLEAERFNALPGQFTAAFGGKSVRWRFRVKEVDDDFVVYEHRLRGESLPGGEFDYVAKTSVSIWLEVEHSRSPQSGYTANRIPRGELGDGEAVKKLKKGDVLTLSGKLAFRNWAQLGGLSRDGAAVRTFTVSIDDAAIRLD
jgi:hypothetical protein